MSGQERHMLMPARVTPVRQILRGTTHLVTLRIPAMPIAHSGRCRSPVPAKAITRGVTPLGRSTSPASGPWSSPPFVFLIDSPPSFTLWALWTRRSQTASAMVSSPMTECQFLGSSWLVTMVDDVP